ncbi:MAG: choline kinase [Candidatus Margulisbacteria bacterium GWF2_35_9]|nr:MAG: choline kinase [Candidatus Margulisbacteria bacterium GWF2_35_9]
MITQFKKAILKSTKAKNLFEIEKIQDLWSGYGRIVRCELEGASIKTVVVKHVQLPKKSSHIRSTDISHNRKLKSYKVETAWYKQWSKYCDNTCRVPHCLLIDTQGDEVLMVLEDLDAAGFPERRSFVTWKELELCLSWLANFHATFIGKKPENLWRTGTYWHLSTRPDELNVLTDIPLKQAAVAIDQKLQQTSFKTFVHGDAKLANFCFSPNGNHVAMVDFQYVGGGCGMKDVAYFLGSCLNEDECEKMQSQCLDYYFKILKESLVSRSKDRDITAIEEEWRELYPVAWTDFHRFMKGWSPGNWKTNTYSERLAREVIKNLNRTGQNEP